MTAPLWAIPKYLFYLVLAGAAVVYALNYTPFFRPPGVDAALLNADKLEGSYGEEYLRRRLRFHTRIAIALAYALMSAAYAVLPRIFPAAAPAAYRSRP